MTAPYQLPADLETQPLGVSWKSVGQTGNTQPGPSLNQQALLNICWQATNMVDAEAGQSVRSTVATESVFAPSHRVGVLASGPALMMTSQGPVAKVVRAQIQPANSLPYTSWVTLPVGHAYPEEELYGLYGSSAPGMATGGGFKIVFDGTYVNWGLGRLGTRVQVTYLAGWPHAQLTEAATQGASTLQVTDITGWTGASGWVSDGQNTESIHCVSVAQTPPAAWSATRNYVPGQYVAFGGIIWMAAVASGPSTPSGVIQPSSGSTAFWLASPEPAGPGTLTLASPLIFSHGVPVLVTALPPKLRYACALYAKAQGLQRGMATLIPGQGTTGTSDLQSAIQAALHEATLEVLPFRRVY